MVVSPLVSGPAPTSSNPAGRRSDRRQHVGTVVMLVWSIVLGVIIALVGLIAFGGFAKGKWY
jgi:hypothetical protein